MQMNTSVVLVSAFGRGHWLAAALAKEGIKSTLIDVTHKLGVWPSEDIEGPFGFFRTDKISESQMERINADDHFQEVANGFTVWLKNGPVEFKGPLSRYRLEKLDMAPAALKALMDGTVTRAPSEVTQFSFNEKWLVDLAHQLSSTTYHPSARGSTQGRMLPLGSSFFTRSATRTGLDKSLQWLESKGVDVIRPQEVFDISFGPGKTIEGIEVRGDTKGLLHTEQMVWMLSSEESHFLNSKVAAYFYPAGAQESEWAWVRYRVSLQECPERESLPLHTLMIEDLHSPWSHENLVILQRTAVKEQFDVWMRLPTVQRFNKEYLTERGARVLGYLRERLSKAEPQILNFPQEYYYTYAQLGAPRFVVFNREQKTKAQNHTSYKNFFVDGPEVWEQYSWENYFDAHQFIRFKITNWWKEKLLKEQKEKRRKGQA